MPATTVAVLGSTGSIGTQTLEVVTDQPDEFDVVALGAARSVDLLIEQATRFRPEVVAIADASLAASVAAGVPPGTEVLAGPDAMADAAVIAEPTDLEVIRAHKGVVRFNLVVQGKAAHSSKPYLGINAIAKMARLRSST